jgi:polyribonucleotide nucleotidyltransferase
MAMQVKQRTIGGQALSIETGRMGKLANGAVVVRLGDTMVFVAAVDGPAREGIDFFPLTMDYREKPSAAGKIPGGFFKREGRPTTKEILTMRCMDRPIRPLFPDAYRKEVQIQAVVLSADPLHDPDVLAVTGASAALHLSDIPFDGPLGAVRVGYCGGQFVLNPTHEQRKSSLLDLVVAGTKDAVTMVEAGAKELPEDKMIEAIKFGHAAVQEICALQDELKAAFGAVTKQVPAPLPGDEALRASVEKAYLGRAREGLTARGGKLEKAKALKDVEKACIAEFAPQGAADPARLSLVKRYFEGASKAAFREITLTGTRYDGRKGDEIRPIHSEVGLLPRAHGSCLFTRGETQAICTATLGTKLDEQIVDGLLDEERRRFLLHYNFPSFSVREVKPIRGPGRREIGHGNLAERAVEPVLPDHDSFPYTIRIVADILESNGSSSMATICGGILALMDAGVKIRQPVAGVAMGLVTDGDRVAILSDIAGKEDAWGDMDFKVAGTHVGITALQMDIKVKGLTYDVMARALEQAKAGRVHILRKMLEALARPRADTSPHAPRSQRVKIPVDKIGALIGPGGKNIRKIQEDTKTEIAVEDDGTVTVYGVNADGVRAAMARVEGLSAVPEVGRVYEGPVVSIKDFGAFVEFLPGAEGLVHVSELADGYVKSPSDVVKQGEILRVKVVGFEERSGKVRLSRKAVLLDEKAAKA